MIDNDPRTTDEIRHDLMTRAIDFLSYFYADAGSRSLSMTAATETIYGTSGRGNPRAVRILETLASLRMLQIDGAKKRTVRITQKGIDLIGTDSARWTEFKADMDRLKSL